jgi:hypothetical protein
MNKERTADVADTAGIKKINEKGTPCHSIQWQESFSYPVILLYILLSAVSFLWHSLLALLPSFDYSLVGAKLSMNALSLYSVRKLC